MLCVLSLLLSFWPLGSSGYWDLYQTCAQGDGSWAGGACWVAQAPHLVPYLGLITQQILFCSRPLFRLKPAGVTHGGAPRSKFPLLQTI